LNRFEPNAIDKVLQLLRLDIVLKASRIGFLAQSGLKSRKMGLALDLSVDDGAGEFVGVGEIRLPAA
jgi:hypothetical protein